MVGCQGAPKRKWKPTESCRGVLHGQRSKSIQMFARPGARRFCCHETSLPRDQPTVCDAVDSEFAEWNCGGVGISPYVEAPRRRGPPTLTTQPKGMPGSRLAAVCDAQLCLMQITANQDRLRRVETEANGS